MTTLAEYYNNPGALKPPGGKRDFYEGQFGVDDQGFAIFTERKFGEKALMQDIQAKLKRGLKTPSLFVDEYTKGDKPENQNAYKVFIAGGLGLKSTDDEFPKDAATKIANLITQFESGKREELAPAAKEQASVQDEGAELTMTDRLGKIAEDAKKLAGEAIEEYPTAARIAMDLAGGEAGRRIGKGLEDYRRRAVIEQARDAALARRAAPPAPPPPPPAPAAPASPLDTVSRKVPGSSGAANWTRAMGHDIPHVLAETAESMRKTDPRGGQNIIDRDIKNMEKIRRLGNFVLDGEGTNQLMLTPEAAANRPPPPAPPPPPPPAPPPKPSLMSRLRGATIPFRAAPGMTGFLGGVGALDLGYQAYESLQEDDPVRASIAATGALGSGMSLIPTVPTRLGGSALAVASPLALFAYDKMMRKMREKPQDITKEGPLRYFFE